MIFKSKKILAHLCLERWLIKENLKISSETEQPQLNHDPEYTVTNSPIYLSYLLSKQKDTVTLSSGSTFVFLSKSQSL